MNITVNGKEYILEYTFEAAECHECIDAAMDIFGGMMTAKIDSKHSEEMHPLLGMLLTNPSNSNCFKASLIGVLEIFNSLERTTSFNFCPFSYSSFKILSLKIQKIR